MKYERLWDRLFEFLNGWSTASELAPGRIEVTLQNADGSNRRVAILMTSDEWDNMVTIPWGDFDSAAQEVRKAILRLRHHERFLIYADYGLVPSATPYLPVDPVKHELEDMARHHPEGFGRWAVTDHDGNVVNESGSHSD